MRKLKIYNSLTNSIEEFKPLEEGKVSMYVCGPTVYDDVHIGNCRPVVVFDVLYRLLTYIGYDVTYISNITDVDDKIIKRAMERSISEKELTLESIKEYMALRHKLNAIDPSYMPKVTDNMDNIIRFIELLIEKGYAYEVNGDVYFRISKVKGYGRLSNLKLDELQVGARIEENESKENPYDFVLWKKTEVGIKWESRWSKGRPGWHSECVVMISSIYKNGLIDIHGGGFDLKFPHHENEIAQAYGAFDTLLANYWMHNGYINMNNQKMSKSLGNIKTGKEIVEKYGVNVTRVAILQAHYRAPINFQDELMETSKTEANKILEPLKKASVKLQLENFETKDLNRELLDRFLDALCDDLNISNGFTVLFEMAKNLNQALRGRDLNLIGTYANTIKEAISILGLVPDNVCLTEEDRDLFSKWNEAKANKDYAKADEYRLALMGRGLL